MMRVGIAVVLAGTLILGSGCASRLPTGDGDASASPVAQISPNEVIARDFARAIVQIPGLAPATTTMRFDSQEAASDRFLAALQAALTQAGYAIQMASEPGRPNRVGHVEKRETEAGGSIFTTHEAAVGNVGFRRQYRIDAGGRVTPASALFVKGADATSLVVDDSLFDSAVVAFPDRNATTVSIAESVVPASGLPVADAPAKQAVLSAIPPEQVLPRLPLTASISSPLISAAQASARATDAGFGASLTQGTGREILPYTRNVFDIGQSNFDDLLVGYQNIDERILVFGNDSLRLGNQNKSIIASMVNRFESHRDVMSLVGCSLGPTSLKNGNQTLALGRANRVKEALVLAGVPQDRILDEGCWAGQSDRKMPSRGVVITHRRERA